jgi:hypothetical protein
LNIELDREILLEQVAATHLDAHHGHVRPGEFGRDERAGAERSTEAQAYRGPRPIRGRHETFGFARPVLDDAHEVIVSEQSAAIGTWHNAPARGAQTA